MTAENTPQPVDQDRAVEVLGLTAPVARTVVNKLLAAGVPFMATGRRNADDRPTYVVDLTVRGTSSAVLVMLGRLVPASALKL